jgi:hypothetical protein
MGRVGNIPSGEGSSSGAPQPPRHARVVDRNPQRVVMAAAVSPAQTAAAAAAAAAPPPPLLGRASLNQASGSRDRLIITDEMRKNALAALSRRIVQEYQTSARPDPQRLWNSCPAELREDPRFCEWALDLPGELYQFFSAEVLTDSALQARLLEIDPLVLIHKQPTNFDLMVDLASGNPGFMDALPDGFWNSVDHVKLLLVRLPTAALDMVPFAKLEVPAVGKVLHVNTTPLHSIAITKLLIRVPKFGLTALLWAPQSTQEAVFRGFSERDRAELKRLFSSYDAGFRESMLKVVHPNIRAHLSQ